MGKFTPGPWEYIPGTEHHGPYVVGPYGSDICDCYAMSNPLALSVRNGGDSKPIWHMGEEADPNACLIAAAPATLSELRVVLTFLEDECCDELAQNEEGSFAAEARKRADSIAAVLKQAMGEV